MKCKADGQNLIFEDVGCSYVLTLTDIPKTMREIVEEYYLNMRCANDRGSGSGWTDHVIEKLRHRQERLKTALMELAKEFLNETATQYAYERWLAKQPPKTKKIESEIL